MKGIIFSILHYLWVRRDDTIELYNEIRKDGKIRYNDFEKVINYYKAGGFIPGEEDDVFVGGITKLKKNTSKNLVQYNQSRSTCALYSRLRTVMYNVKGLTYTIDEHEAIAALAEKYGYLQRTGDKAGMKFSDADKVITEWTLKNKGIQLKYDKVRYGGDIDLERKALGYSKSIGGGITGKYIKDFRYDGEIDEEYTFDEKILYHHAFTEEPDNLLTENYPTQFGNNNRYKNPLVSDFVNQGIFFGWAYYIFSDDEIKEDIMDEKREEYIIKKFSIEEQIAIRDLLLVLDQEKKSGYKQVFNLLIVESFEETKTRILQEIYGARLSKRITKK